MPSEPWVLPPEKQVHVASTTQPRASPFVAHGGDFTALRLDPDLDRYESDLAKNLELKIRGRLGEGFKEDNQLRILNCVATLTESGVMYEVDPRHVDLLAGSMGLTKANGVGTPGTKNPVADYDATKSNESEALQATDSLEPSHGDNLEPLLGDQKVLYSLSVTTRSCRRHPPS